VRGITRRFGSTLALAPLELELDPGQITGLLGPNGSGKSTLLRILVGLVRPDAGEAWVDGVRLRGDGTPIRARATYAPGEIALYGELRGSAQLAFLTRGRPRAALRKALDIATSLGLPLAARVRAYSHGMKRQLLLAAALAPDVRVRILDEPTEGLDPTKRGEVIELLRADAGQGRTILVSSHHLGEVDRLCERLIFLAKGKLIADTTAAELAQRARRYVRLRYAEGVDLAAVNARLIGFGVERIAVDGTRLGVFLREDDPRVFLSALSAARELPAPSTIEHGQLSLAELYRELYGVEGC
jgi:ABC-2 type transport system ATP-binding protein